MPAPKKEKPANLPPMVRNLVNKATDIMADMQSIYDELEHVDVSQ